MIENADSTGWSVEELIAFFDRLEIPKNAYSIYSNQDESYCVVREGSEWLIYYSERGRRNHLGWGKNESQALNLLKLFVLEGVKTT